MSAEVVGGVVIKWLWAPFTAWVLWLIQSREKRIKDLETKSHESSETIAVLQQEVNVLRESLKAYLDKQDKLLEDIHAIRTSTAVIETKVTHLEQKGK